MIRSYVDSGVLIAAARGTDAVSSAAMKTLDDPEREFASSSFVQLEVLPKARFHHRVAEVSFYEAFFASVPNWPSGLEDVVAHAHRIAEQYGVAAFDALHIAAALSTLAEEFVTTERPGKPLYRVTELRIVSVRPEAET